MSDEEKKKSQDPFDMLLNAMQSGGEGDNRANLQKIIGELGEFYDSLDLVLKHGKDWQKKLAVQLFQTLQIGLKGKLEEFCDKEGVDISKLEAFFRHPETMKSPAAQEIKTEIDAMKEKVEPKYNKEKQRLENEKESARIKKRSRKRKMEKNIKSKM